MAVNPLPLECAAKTDPGRSPDKQVNEDHERHGHTPFGFLALVCDGMGGHEGGKEASALAASTIFEQLEQTPVSSTTAGVALKHAIEEANRRVYAMGEGKAHGRPGSTVVALLFHDGGVEVAHVGDSRIYRVRGVECVPLTRDHSQVQLMVDAGMLTPEQAKVHPDANKITRALGIDEEVRVEVQAQPQGFLAGDTYLLCSDGLSDLVEPDDMVRLVGGAPLQQAAGQLVDLANARGGHDNITALLVRTKSGSQQTTSSGEGRITQVMPPVGGGAAQPVAKTMLGMPAVEAQPMPRAPATTMVMEGAPQAGAGVAHGAHVPNAPQRERAPASRGPLVVGLLVALVLLGGLAALFFVQWRERGGVHKEVPEGVASSLGSLPAAPPNSGEIEPLRPAASSAASAPDAPADADEDEVEPLTEQLAPAHANQPVPAGSGRPSGRSSGGPSPR